MQFDLLKKKLREEIKKSPNAIKYIDSELHLRHNSKSFTNSNLKDKQPLASAVSAPEVQSAVVDFGTISSSSSGNHKHSCAKNLPSDTIARPLALHVESSRQIFEAFSSGDPDRHKGHSDNENGDCQVCLIRNVRDDLVNITKLVQERNEQISKLKSKYLRSYFKSHIGDTQ